MCSGNQRTHLDTRVAAGAHAQGAGALDDARHDVPGGVADCNQYGNGHAPLPGRTECRAGHGIGYRIGIRIGHGDQVVLRAPERLHELAVGRSG